MTIFQRLKAIFIYELKAYSRRPLFMFCMVVAPVLCVIFFSTLMDKGLPTKLPAGIVDEDNTNISRTIVRTIDALEETNLAYSYPSFSEARKAMQRGEIFAFFTFRKVRPKMPSPTDSRNCRSTPTKPTSCQAPC